MVTSSIDEIRQALQTINDTYDLLDRLMPTMASIIIAKIILHDLVVTSRQPSLNIPQTMTKKR